MANTTLTLADARALRVGQCLLGTDGKVWRVDGKPDPDPDRPLTALLRCYRETQLLKEANVRDFALTKGICPICRSEVEVLSSRRDINGRPVGACGDAFSVAQWFETER